LELAVAVTLICEGVAAVAVMLLFEVGVATLFEREIVDATAEASEIAVTIVGVVVGIEIVVCRGGKLAVNVNPLTEGVASVSPRLDIATVVRKCL
jgi:hypothetical protein